MNMNNECSSSILLLHLQYFSFLSSVSSALGNEIEDILSYDGNDDIPTTPLVDNTDQAVVVTASPSPVSSEKTIPYGVELIEHIVVYDKKLLNSTL